MHFSTVYEILRIQSEKLHDADAILSPGYTPITYGELFAQVQKMVAQLHAFGIAPNDRIAVALPNGPEMAMAFLATACAAISAPLNPSFTSEEYEFYLSDLRAKAILAFQGDASPALAIARRLRINTFEIGLSDLKTKGNLSILGASHFSSAKVKYPQGENYALMLHTSGTTSKPKLVPLTHKNICISAANISASLNLNATDRCLNMMPLFHIHGLMGALCASLAAGGSVICAPGCDTDKFFGWLKAFRPTWYTAVPTMHQAISNAAEKNKHIISSNPLRMIRSCSASLHPQLMASLESTFNAPVVEAYGMTEACHQISINPLPPRPRKLKSVGIPTGIQVAIMNSEGKLLSKDTIGEIVIKGPNVTNGYEGNPLANEDAFTDGWFRTGDQGYTDADGYIFITGRIKEIINRGGEKISPREIDEVFLEHHQVAQAITFALPHPTLGQDIAVAVVPRDNAIIDERQLREFAFERLAAFKVPSKVLTVDAIPKGPTGKLQRIGLHQKLAEKLYPDYIAPRSSIENRIAEIWKELLKIEKIGSHDNFFIMGGDSITALRLVSEIKTVFDIELALPLIFRFPTVSQLSRLVFIGSEKPSSRSMLKVSSGVGEHSLFCIPGSKGNVFRVFADLARILEPAYTVYGFQDSYRNPMKIELLSAKYVQEIISMDIKDPISLLGFCSGAVVAFEMARQLDHMGRKVAFLGMVEPSPICANVFDPYIDTFSRIFHRAIRRGSHFSRNMLALNRNEKKMYLLIRLRLYAVHLAARLYQPKIYPGKLYLYLSNESLKKERIQRMLWTVYSENSPAVRQISGSHDSIIDNPAMQSLMSKLRPDLTDEAFSAAAKN